MVYDVLADRVKSVTLGSVRASIADTIAGQENKIETVKTEIKSDMKRVQEAATAWLTNGKGYAYFRKDDSGNIIDILFMDTQDTKTAVNVMRVGQSGIGFSHNGVGGPYESAWTIDGKFNADYIYSGTLQGLLFKAGTIESIDGKIKIDLSQENSEPIFNTGISTNGLTVRADESGAEKLIQVKAKKTSGGKNYGNLELFSVGGNKLLSIYEVFSDLEGTIPVGVQLELFSEDALHGVFLSSSNGSSGLYTYSEGFEVGSFVSKGSFVDGSARSELWTDVINEKQISWKSNGDGTYTLIGE
jgi:hypothetical protein